MLYTPFLSCMDAACEEPVCRLWPPLPSFNDIKELSKVLLGPSDICLSDSFPESRGPLKSAHQSLKKGSLKKSSLPTVVTATPSPDISKVSLSASQVYPHQTEARLHLSVSK